MAAAAALVVGAFAAAWAARCTLSCAFAAAGCRSASLGCSQPAKSCRGHRSSGAEAKVLGRVRCPAPHEARPVRAVAREWGALHPHTHSFTPCTASHPRRGCLRGDLHAMMRIAPVSQAGGSPRAVAARLPRACLLSLGVSPHGAGLDPLVDAPGAATEVHHRRGASNLASFPLVSQSGSGRGVPSEGPMSAPAAAVGGSWAAVGMCRAKSAKFCAAGRAPVAFRLAGRFCRGMFFRGQFVGYA